MQYSASGDGRAPGAGIAEDAHPDRGSVAGSRARGPITRFPYPGEAPRVAFRVPDIGLRDGVRVPIDDPGAQEIWVDPPDEQETRTLLGLLPALRRGALDPLMVPGVRDGVVVRVRGISLPEHPPGRVYAPSEPSPTESVESPEGTGQQSGDESGGVQGWAWPADAQAGPHLRARARSRSRGRLLDVVFAAAAAFAAAGPRAAGAVATLSTQGQRHTGGVRGVLGRAFDPTCGFPGEGPMARTATRGEVLKLSTINVTSWAGGVARGALGTRADVLLLQETRLEGPALRGARAEARRGGYWGRWTQASRLSRMGAASGGLSELCHVDRAWRKGGSGLNHPHALEGRWSHTVFLAGGTQVHVFNVYGWPEGSPDRAARQGALWVEIFTEIAALGGAPWVAGGDWNATPDEVWPHVLNPRVGGVLPGPASRRPTCFPVSGEPRELDFFLISRSLSHCVQRYNVGLPGDYSVHCEVALTLRLEGLNRPVPTLIRPRAIPELEAPPGPLQGVPPGQEGAPRRRALHWGDPIGLASTAQGSWDAWTRKAEDCLLRASAIPEARWGPYRGRGEGIKIRRRRPCPRTTTAAGGEEHGRARALAVRAARYRDLARAKRDGRTVLAGHLAEAIASDPPRDQDPEWARRDRAIATGLARTEQVQAWAGEALLLAKAASQGVAAARREAWTQWANQVWERSPGKLYAWCRGEKPPSIVATTDATGEWLMQPDEVVGEATRQWEALWSPPNGGGEPPPGLPFNELPGMEPLTGGLLRGIVARMSVHKAGGLDAWSVRELRALPEQAFHDLARVLHQVEAEGVWPVGLTGAVVALLPKKEDHAPMAQRPISLLPMVYRLWAATRGSLLKRWLGERGHVSAWGHGPGRGADTAAWMGAVQAELAAARGQDAFGAYVDCEKCYDHVDLEALGFEGCLRGLGRLVRLAAAQYRGTRFVRWAGALGRGVTPSSGIPAGCPLANGMLHLYLLGAMRGTEEEAPSAELRTYVDDWRLFASGERAAASRAIVGGLHAARRQLESKGMVVSLSKTVLLASGAAARATLRAAAGEHKGMVSLAVKDLGVDDTLGACNRRAVQRKRVGDAAEAGSRIARLPTGWAGRITMAGALARSQYAWGADTLGMSAGTLRHLRKWIAHAVLGGSPARRAPEVVLALAAPGSFLEPRLHLLYVTVTNWSKRLAEHPDLGQTVELVWQKEVADPTPVSRHRGPIAVLVAAIRGVGWRPDAPASWATEAGARVNPANLEETSCRLVHRLRDLRWAGDRKSTRLNSSHSSVSRMPSSA